MGQYFCYEIASMIMMLVFIVRATVFASDRSVLTPIEKRIAGIIQNKSPRPMTIIGSEYMSVLYCMIFLIGFFVNSILLLKGLGSIGIGLGAILLLLASGGITFSTIIPENRYVTVSIFGKNLPIVVFGCKTRELFWFPFVSYELNSDPVVSKIETFTHSIPATGRRGDTVSVNFVLVLDITRIAGLISQCYGTDVFEKAFAKAIERFAAGYNGWTRQLRGDMLVESINELKQFKTLTSTHSVVITGLLHYYLCKELWPNLDFPIPEDFGMNGGWMTAGNNNRIYLESEAFVSVNPVALKVWVS